jgi:hypothetical protein
LITVEDEILLIMGIKKLLEKIDLEVFEFEETNDKMPERILLNSKDYFSLAQHLKPENAEFQNLPAVDYTYNNIVLKRRLDFTDEQIEFE